MRKYEDFRCSNRVEPFLNPTPNSGEERRCADDLEQLVSMLLSVKGKKINDSQIFDPMSQDNEQ